MSLALCTPRICWRATPSASQAGALEAAQSLGLSPGRVLAVALPMARLWLIGGVSLALMEALADFGIGVDFAFDAFTTAIYKARFAMFSLSSARNCRLAGAAGVWSLIWLEQRSRGGRALPRRRGWRSYSRACRHKYSRRWPAVLPAWCCCWLLCCRLANCWCGWRGWKPTRRPLVSTLSGIRWRWPSWPPPCDAVRWPCPHAPAPRPRPRRGCGCAWPPGYAVPGNGAGGGFVHPGGGAG